MEALPKHLQPSSQINNTVLKEESLMSMEYLNRKNNQKGFTLIEILISISLLSLVLLMTYNMHLFNYKVFNRGSSKADIQSNLRLNVDFISDKIRYASNLKILANKPSTFDPLKQYIYSEGGVLKFYDVGTLKDVAGSLGGVSSTIYFEDKDAQTVTFKVYGTQKDESYEIDSSVYMLNVGTGGIAESNGAAIEFMPGIPVNANINAKPVESITISPSPSSIENIARNNSVNFTAVVTPADASINTVSWSVKINDVDSPTAHIISTGPSTACLSLTNAIIGAIIKVKASAMDGTSVSSSPYSLTVIDDPYAIPTALVIKSSIPDVPEDPSPDYIFQANGLLQMKSYISPVTANTSVEWSIDKTSAVATIDIYGVLKTNSLNTSLGNIIVTATSKSNPALSATKTINLIKNINSAADIIVNFDHLTGNDYTITCNVVSTGKAALNTGVKGIQHYVNSGSIIDNNTNPFIEEVKNNDTIYIIFKLLNGSDIIKSIKK